PILTARIRQDEALMSDVQSVSAVSARIRHNLEADPDLQNIWMQGEVSNMTKARSGHWYFTLKDKDAAIRCVMWKSAAARQKTIPQEGDQLAAYGRVGVYEPRGDVQFYAEVVRPVGIGDLYAQYERLKNQLAEQGLFDADVKKPIPSFPRRIGIVTSADAAAFQDVQNVLRRRFPVAEVVLVPSLVQGVSAPPMLVAALQRLDDGAACDVILVVRGGGSIEDLWAFNDEAFARALYNVRTPVISGVGHETDFTITDFVADLRAPTPSAAAELATPDLSNFRATLTEANAYLRATINNAITSRRERLSTTRRALGYLSPVSDIRNHRQRTDELRARAASLQAANLARLRERLTTSAAALHAASPQALLDRGYALVTDADGNVVRRTDEVASGDSLTVRLSDGAVSATVD
ncbi:MAG: exodeoxyribonuclease VII large subunit, partial [Chloroflexota bacterium]